MMMGVERFKKGFETWIYPVARLTDHIASAVLFLLMALTIADVFLRKVFSRSILGTVEVSEFMLLIIIFFSLARTEALNGHVKVDLVMSRLGPRIQGIVDMVTQGVCCVLSVLITWSSLVYSEKMREAGEVSQDLWLPIYPFIYVVALGCALLSLTLMVKFLQSLVKAIEP